MECYISCSLRSKRLSNIGRAVLGNVGDARSTREGKGRKRLSNIERAMLGIETREERGYISCNSPTKKLHYCTIRSVSYALWDSFQTIVVRGLC